MHIVQNVRDVDNRVVLADNCMLKVHSKKLLILNMLLSAGINEFASGTFQNFSSNINVIQA